MNIKCEVIRDLLPLYVEGVVSEESRALIEEHLSECADCSEYLKLLQEDLPDISEDAFADEAASLKKIKSKMLRNRVMIVLVTLAFAVIAGAVLHSQHLAEYSGSLDENLSYELPAGYEFEESSENPTFDVILYGIFFPLYSPIFRIYIITHTKCGEQVIKYRICGGIKELCDCFDLRSLLADRVRRLDTICFHIAFRLA